MLCFRPALTDPNERFTVQDTGMGTALAPSGGDGSVPITFSTRASRFVRLTQYLGTVAETTVENDEIFQRS